MTLGTRPYQHGLSEIGRDTWAWRQSDGSWGWSNASLVTDESPAAMVGMQQPAADMGAVEFFLHSFDRFDFASVTPTPPNRTFDGERRRAAGPRSCAGHQHERLRQLG